MDITAARLIQIALRALMVYLVGRGGVDSQHAATLTHAASEFWLAGLAVLGDLAIHSARFGALAKAVELFLTPTDGAVEDPSSPPPPPSNPTRLKAELRTAAPAALFLAVLVGGSVLGFGGCANTERKQIGQAATTVNAAAVAGTSLTTARQISPATAQTLLTSLQTAEAAIDAWNTARITAPPGDTTALTEAAAAAQAAIVQLNASLAAAQAEAATQPAPK